MFSTTTGRCEADQQSAFNPDLKRGTPKPRFELVRAYWDASWRAAKQ